MTSGPEATPENTLLQIKRKEIELQALMLSARREADEIVADGRREASILRHAGELTAENEALALRAAELDAARGAADLIRREYDERVAALRLDDDGVARLAERIRRAVAPGAS